MLLSSTQHEKERKDLDEFEDNSSLTDFKIEKRKCFFCEEKVNFWFYYRINRSLGLEFVKQSWNNINTPIICKSCFNNLKVRNIKKYLNQKPIRNRTCYQCHQELTFYEFWTSNYDMSPKDIVNTWQSKHVELLCCSCHSEMVRNEKIKNQINKAREIKTLLNSSELEALESIEKQLGIPLPSLSHVNYFGSLGFKVSNEGHVSGLSLSSCELAHVPLEIQQFNHLACLDLSNNQLRTFPDWIQNFPSLEWINIYNNEEIENSVKLKEISDIQEKKRGFLIISKNHYGNYDNSEYLLGTLIKLSQFVEKKKLISED